MTWFDAPPMPTARGYCQAGLVTYPDGSQGVLVAGGADQDYNAIDTVEFLNLRTMVWEPKQNLPTQIRKGQSVPYLDSFVIVGGLNDATSNATEFLDGVLYYNPSLDQWDQVAQMEYPRYNFAAFLVPDRYAYCH